MTPRLMLRLDSPTPTPRQRPFWPLNLSELLVDLWLAGVVFMIAKLIVGLSWTLRDAEHSAQLRDTGWTTSLSEAATLLKIRRDVILLQSDRIHVASTYGIFRSRIVLPVEASAWDCERRRLVLLHELAHIKRRDFLTQMLARLSWAFYWFNPLAYFAVARMAAEQEQACDDMVLSTGANPPQYASHLLAMVRAYRAGTLSRWPALAMAQPSHFTSRLAAILDRTRRRHPPSLRASLVVILASLACVVTVGTIRLQSAPIALASPAPVARTVGALTIVEQQHPSIPSGTHSIEITKQSQRETFRKWQGEDAADGVTDQQRETFQSQRLDAAQTMDEQNQYAREYYRRINYANKHFDWSTAGWNKPGWRSERGRIYVTYGNPDKIESYSSSGNYEEPFTYPYEIWTYKHIEGVDNNVQFEFIDPSLNGEYRLTEQRSPKLLQSMAQQTIDPAWFGTWKLQFPAQGAASQNTDVPTINIDSISGGVRISFDIIADAMILTHHGPESILVRDGHWIVNGRYVGPANLFLPFDGKESPEMAGTTISIDRIGASAFDLLQHLPWSFDYTWINRIHFVLASDAKTLTATRDAIQTAGVDFGSRQFVMAKQ